MVNKANVLDVSMKV